MKMRSIGIDTFLRKFVAPVMMLVAMTAALVSCGNSGSKGRDEGAPLRVSVSNGAQAWLASQIAGDDAEVTALIRPGADAETFEPDMATLSALQSSDLYLHTDAEGFERKMAGKAAEELPGLKTVNVAEGVALLYGTHDHAGESRAGGAAQGHHTPDPHLLGSVRSAGIITANMARAMAEADTLHASAYQARLRDLESRLDSLDSRYRRIASQASANGRKITFLVMHPALSYLARDYGFEQIAIESGGKEPSPREYAARLQDAKSARPGIFFVEEGADDSRSREIADMVGARIATFRIDDARWYNNMLKIANTLENRK